MYDAFSVEFDQHFDQTVEVILHLRFAYPTATTQQLLQCSVCGLLHENIDIFLVFEDMSEGKNVEVV